MHLVLTRCRIDRHHTAFMNIARTNRPAGATAKRRLARMLTALRATSPAREIELDHRTPWELLIATILSAQCTDQRVNQVTPNLFRRYQELHDYATADPKELEALIRPTGFFKAKARSLMQCAKVLTECFEGKVPATMEALITLPGVGRKTANVILGNAFGKPGVVVDTHVKRVSWRLQLTRHVDPTKVEMDLRQLLPEEQWTDASQRLLLHGRYICLARAPKCRQCCVYTDCHWEGKIAR